jgi:FkbM family methyltransferase
VEVPVEAGDHIIQSNEAPTPTVLKIDVEGAEMDVLQDLSGMFSAGNINAVVCEVHLPIEGPSPSVENFRLC